MEVQGIGSFPLLIFPVHRVEDIANELSFPPFLGKEAVRGPEFFLFAFDFFPMSMALWIVGDIQLLFFFPPLFIRELEIVNGR